MTAILNSCKCSCTSAVHSRRSWNHDDTPSENVFCTSSSTMASNLYLQDLLVQHVRPARFLQGRSADSSAFFWTQTSNNDWNGAVGRRDTTRHREYRLACSTSWCSFPASDFSVANHQIMAKCCIRADLKFPKSKHSTGRSVYAATFAKTGVPRVHLCRRGLALCLLRELTWQQSLHIKGKVTCCAFTFLERGDQHSAAWT